MGDLTQEFQRAYELAYFIYPKKEIALQVSIKALSKLAIDCEAQQKHLSAFTPKVFRTRVYLHTLQRLQRLVYVASEPYEKKHEYPGSGIRLTQEDFIIRFIKHLVEITTRRNSFYVVVGLCRFLFHYNHSETVRIYDIIIQDPNRYKNRNYFRKQKGILMRDFKRRFGEILHTHSSPGKEERIETQEHSSHHISLVTECLNRFTLWGTSCVLPERFNPMFDILPPLRFEGTDPDAEHDVEMRRMHSLLHPQCFLRLSQTLGFAPPDECLALPIFFYANDDEPPGTLGDRRNPPPLVEDDFKRMKSVLTKQACRRRKARPDLLLFLVDGTQYARVDLS
jgi:hypothetical protein